METNMLMIQPMDISSALDWWDEWKLRILVLASTVIQLFQFTFGTCRKFSVPTWFRLCIWLTYLAGDSLAIYALATLFNRHNSRDGSAVARSTLEVLWAPILLIHLAGQEQITSYSVQDNELWRRHVVTLVTQVAIAVYVFCKSWSGEKRLLQAAVLLFIVGIYKFSTKPWALKKATFNNLVKRPASLPRRKKLIGSTGSPLMKCWTRLTASLGPPIFLVNGLRTYFEKEASLVSLVPAEFEEEEEDEREEDFKFDEYVQMARKLVTEPLQRAGEPLHLSIPNTELFVADLVVTYRRRLRILKFMSAIGNMQVNVIQQLLQHVYILLYTRFRILTTPIGFALRLLTFSLAAAAIGLFARRHNDDVYNVHDVRVTYILMCSISLLEIMSINNIAIAAPTPLWPASRQLSSMVAQQSIMLCVARRRRPPRLHKLAVLVGCERYWYITQARAKGRITAAVTTHVLAGWADYIHDTASYKSFNDLRGQWAVSKTFRLGTPTGMALWMALDDKIRRDAPGLLSSSLEETLNEHQQVLRTSLEEPFDQSVLHWHIATEMMISSDGDSALGVGKFSLEISGYMMYLLSVRPEMLALGSRQHLFDNACDDIEFIARYWSTEELMHGWFRCADDHISLAKGVLRMARNPLVHGNCVGPHISKACKLAEALMELVPGKNARWDMVEGVWLEMLCYAASRCRGYLHATSMARGGELLNHVWLVQCLLGMETLSDKLQRPAVQEDEGHMQQDAAEDQTKPATAAAPATGG